MGGSFKTGRPADRGCAINAIAQLIERKTRPGDVNIPFRGLAGQRNDVPRNLELLELF